MLLDDRPAGLPVEAADSAQEDRDGSRMVASGIRVNGWPSLGEEEGHVVRVRDVRGVQCLLASPGREFHVLDLVGLQQGGPAETAHVREPGLWIGDTGDAGEMLDPRAKEAYRRRLTEIEDDLEEARALGDASRVGQATAEREFLALIFPTLASPSRGRCSDRHQVEVALT